MSLAADGQGSLSRRTLLGAAGGAMGAAVLGANGAVARVPAAESGPSYFLRPLGSPDVPCTGPAFQWNDCDCGAIRVSLHATGRPVRITARLAVDHGGPDGSGFGVSFAEDGVDLHRDDQRGLAFAQIEGSTVVSAALEASTVRQVSVGEHTWTLRVRHENPMNDEAAQRSYVRTRRVAPLEFSVVELS